MSARIVFGTFFWKCEPSDFDMNSKRTSQVALLCLLTLGLKFSALFAQGSLTPPGAPAPVFKTLSQIEPRADVLALAGDGSSSHLITNAGSYYLTTNIFAVASGDGVRIQANNVTIDLNGFAIMGALATGSAGIRGINVTNVAIRNGTVRDWATGVTLGSARNCALNDLRILNNRSAGLQAGPNSLVRDCIAEGNGGAGIGAGEGSVISGCTARTNSGGISAGSGSVLSGCSSLSNTNLGIVAGPGSTIRDSVARDNGGIGIQATGRSSVLNCTASRNGSHGIWVINTENDCVVSGCLAMGNRGDGIWVDAANSRISDNTCTANGPVGSTSFAGIRITNSRNRVEGNTLFGNRNRGLIVSASSDGFGSFVVRNTASGNGVNYDIGANNNVGVIVAAPLSGAVLGDTGGAGVGTTNPWANFSH